MEWTQLFNSEVENSFWFPYLIQILFLLENKKKRVIVHYQPLIPIQKEQIQKGLIWITSIGLQIQSFENKEIIVITNSLQKKSFHPIYPKNTFENHKIIKILEMKTRKNIQIKYNPNESKIINKIKVYNDILKDKKLPYRLDYQMYSRIPFYEKHKDKVFVSNYLDEYALILKDEFYEKTRFYLQPGIILEKWNGFQWIMEMIKNKDIQKLYQGICSHSKEYLESIKLIQEFENQILLCC
jgi:hypothetical protein